MIDSGGSFESINHRDVDFDVAGNADDILMAGYELRGATNVFVTDGMLESYSSDGILRLIPNSGLWMMPTKLPHLVRWKNF